jgi:hypothetical protein
LPFDENTLTNEQQALDYSNKYGVVTLFPVKNLSFPSLYKATKGNRQEKFENAWKWADELGYKKQIHYGKLIRKQVTFFSIEMFPYFYVLYRNTPLTQTALRILGIIRRNGPTSTTILRKNLDLWGREKKNEFTKAMDQLQMTFAVAIVSREKPPRQTHIYDLTENWMPNVLLQKAKSTTEAVAEEEILAKMLRNRVVSNPQDLKRILPKWTFTSLSTLDMEPCGLRLRLLHLKEAL